MKISPVSQGSGVPAGASVGNERMPADRIAAAKAVAEGKEPANFRLSQSDTPIDERVERAKQSIKRIKMTTQRSTDRFMPEALASEAEPAAPTPENAIPDSNEQAPVVSEETKPLSPQFAALARQKRALQVKERELAEREAKLTGPNMDEYVSKADLQANPLKVFETGVTYDQLTQALLSNPSGITPEIQELKEEIKALKEGVDKNLSERDERAEQQVLGEMQREADQLVAQGDEYELVREYGYANKAVDLIRKVWKAEGKVLDVSEALGIVENQLLEDAVKAAQLKKVQGKISPQADPTLQSQPTNQPMRTLTNRDGARPQMGRRERALAAFYGKNIK